MEGAKLVSETLAPAVNCGGVGERCGGAEAGSRGPVDPPETRILAVVAKKLGENPNRRRGKGSLSTVVRQGLGGPKAARNPSLSKGMPVNIPAP